MQGEKIFDRVSCAPPCIMLQSAHEQLLLHWQGPALRFSMSQCRWEPLESCTLGSWKCASSAHHSLLYHVRQGTLDAYEFPAW